jgi:hypothetical protein
MIRLRQTIEQGMRHRWLGPLFVLLFCLMLALLFMHAAHDGHDVGTELAQFCLGLTIMFGLIVLIRLRSRVILQLAVVRAVRAPPTARIRTLSPCASFSGSAPPLRL